MPQQGKRIMQIAWQSWRSQVDELCVGESLGKALQPRSGCAPTYTEDAESIV